MKNLYLILAACAVFSACKKNNAPVDPDPGTGNTTGATLSTSLIAAWSEPFRGALFTPNTSTGHNMAVDRSGNHYLFLTFTGTADLDPGAGVATVSGGSAVLVKYDLSGKYSWHKTFSGLYLNACAVTTDNDGNVFLTGTADKGAAVTGPGFSAGFSTTGLNTFIAAYNAAGNFLWFNTLASHNAVVPNDIQADGNGNVFIQGRFLGDLYYQPGSSLVPLPALGNGQNFVVGFNRNGAFFVLLPIQPSGSASAGGLAVDAAGNVYQCGYFTGNLTYRAAGKVSVLAKSNGAYYLTKYDTNGDQLWLQAFDAQSFGDLNCIAADPAGAIYGTGTTSSASFVFGNALWKFSGNDGSLLWTRSLPAGGHSARPPAVSPAGEIYTTSQFLSTLTIGNQGIVNSSASAVYIAKYLPDGTLSWVFPFAGYNASDRLSPAYLAYAGGRLQFFGKYTGSVNVLNTAAEKAQTSGGTDEYFMAAFLPK